MHESLPLILSGPILRKCHQQQVTIWLALSSLPTDVRLTLTLADTEQALFDEKLNDHQFKTIRVGQHAYITLLDIALDEALPINEVINYQLTFRDEQGEKTLTELLPQICYPGQSQPNFVIQTELDHVIHGSCRKPHAGCPDALPQIDKVVEKSLEEHEQRPDMIIMSGDQIYADDVAGPTLQAIHQIIELLGLTTETWEGANANNTADLFEHEFNYYQREKLLPKCKRNQKLVDLFFGGTQMPIFTTNAAHNHLITLAEVIGMYLLVWSDTLWELVEFDKSEMPEDFIELYEKEQTLIEDFVSGLGAVQRAFAHTPTYMIFDDHDITDDWNLSIGWEQAAYGHTFSKRIIGNALIGYWLFQGWGNNPSVFEDLYEEYKPALENKDQFEQDDLIDSLIAFREWDYTIDTSPAIIVIDTRTNRWRSENSLSSPSGLMDWEALSDLQQKLIHHDTIILVSAAPIYGVKFIEVVQRVFSYFGYALMVDAENWMAHKGAANVILNIFRHPKTPQHFIILSGDVHYSFNFDVSLRFRDGGPDITQVTASGFKNQFPDRLLNIFDRIDRLLYTRYSPLNAFTKRRRMRVRSQKPNTPGSRRLVNSSNFGVVTLKDKHFHSAKVVKANGEEVEFNHD
ncbi:alkaline phosphatase family protein [Leucothrix sargassi]|nr:alkaline phosphatase family protein [Leucothrix sargassi]